PELRHSSSLSGLEALFSTVVVTLPSCQPPLRHKFPMGRSHLEREQVVAHGLPMSVEIGRTSDSASKQTAELEAEGNQSRQIASSHHLWGEAEMSCHTFCTELRVQNFVGGLIARDDSEDKSVTLDRKSTRLNSSHVSISYAVFCLKKKK